MLLSQDEVIFCTYVFGAVIFHVWDLISVGISQCCCALFSYSHIAKIFGFLIYKFRATDELYADILSGQMVTNLRYFGWGVENAGISRWFSFQILNNLLLKNLLGCLFKGAAIWNKLFPISHWIFGIFDLLDTWHLAKVDQLLSLSLAARCRQTFFSYQT